MDFFDDEDDGPPDDAPRRRGGAARPRRASTGAAAGAAGGRPSHQQIRTRQLTFIGASIIVLILLVLAVRGCLDARKERAFKNYVSDLSAIVSESQQLSDGFFSALRGGGDGGDLTLEAQVNGDRGTAGALADRAGNLDAPDEVAGAQQELALSFRIRADALATIADRLDEALGNQGARRAQRDIVERMRWFVASDVLYARASAQIEQALLDEEIVVDGGVPESEFLPTGERQPNYLELSEVQGLLAGAGGGGGGGGGAGPDCDPGDDATHGLGLTSVAASPSGAVLTADAANTLAATDTELTATVQNQGEADEREVTVTIKGDFTGTQTIGAIGAQEESAVTIPLKPSPSGGDSGSVSVTAEPVCGEQVLDNNTLSYELAFE